MKRVFMVMAAFVSVSLLGCGGPLPEEGTEELMSTEEVSQASQELATCPGGYPACSELEGMLCNRRTDCCDGNFLLWCACSSTKRYVCM